MKNNVALYVIGAAFLAVFGTIARADVTVSSGYYDLTPAQSGGGPAVPNPWDGSANTTFYGSAGDISAATSSDPDIAALLIENTGATSVSLSALGLSSGMDVMGRGGVTSPLTLLAGQGYIFAVGDGSDTGLNAETISITLNGTGYSFADATTAQAPDGVLFGDVPQLGFGDETQPWTQDADLLRSGPPPVPEPGTFALMGSGLLGLGLIAGMKRNRMSAAVTSA